jgi:hypothetical protein
MILFGLLRLVSQVFLNRSMTQLRRLLGRCSLHVLAHAYVPHEVAEAHLLGFPLFPLGFNSGGPCSGCGLSRGRGVLSWLQQRKQRAKKRKQSFAGSLLRNSLGEPSRFSAKITATLWLSVAPMESTGVQRICTDSRCLFNNFRGRAIPASYSEREFRENRQSTVCP